MDWEPQLPKNSGFIVALIVAALIIGGGITLLLIYPTTDKISFYVAFAAVVLAPIFVLAAFFVNKQQSKQP